MNILIGSTRPAKVEGARAAIAAIARVDPRFATAELRAHDLTTVAPRMPMSVAEILDGARRRVHALLALSVADFPDRATLPPSPAHAFLAFGLEGGVARVTAGEPEWTLQTWAAVSDGKRWGYGAGPSILLPPAVAGRVSAGEELGDVMDHITGDAVRGTRGAWGVLTLDLIGRREAFRLAVIAACAPFYNAAMWDA